MSLIFWKKHKTPPAPSTTSPTPYGILPVTPFMSHNPWNRYRSEPGTGLEVYKPYDVTPDCSPPSLPEPSQTSYTYPSTSPPLTRPMPAMPAGREETPRRLDIATNTGFWGEQNHPSTPSEPNQQDERLTFPTRPERDAITIDSNTAALDRPTSQHSMKKEQSVDNQEKDSVDKTDLSSLAMEKVHTESPEKATRAISDPAALSIRKGAQSQSPDMAALSAPASDNSMDSNRQANRPMDVIHNMEDKSKYGPDVGWIQEEDLGGQHAKLTMDRLYSSNQYRTESKHPDGKPIWGYYTQRGRHFDADFVRDAESTVDSLLIFAGLFSAVISAFISQTFPLLKDDPVDTLNSILQELRQPGSVPTKTFIVPSYAIRVNCFLIAGLFISMLVALLGILVKQWTRSYQRDLAGISSSHLRARIRHFRHNGVQRWRLSGIIGFLSVLMHLSMFISAIGITDLLLVCAPPVGAVALSILVVGMLFFFLTTVLPLFVLDAPFRSPLSEFILYFRAFMRRRVLLPKWLRRQPRKEDVEGGLEDQMDPFEPETSESSDVVRTRLHLDLDILCHLLKTADKSTERWILDLCLEKLPTLALLEQQHPAMILRKDALVNTYIFLAKGCVIIQESRKVLNPNRRRRAIQLCNFIRWFLSLPRSRDVKARLQRRLRQGFDPLELPQALAADPVAESRIPALAALARLKHLFEQDDQEVRCTVCEKATQELQRLTRDVVSYNEVSRVVTSFIITHSDCLVFHNKSGGSHSRISVANDSLGALRRVLTASLNARETDVTEWTTWVKRRREYGDSELQAWWFDPLLAIIDSQRRVSNENSSSMMPPLERPPNLGPFSTPQKLSRPESNLSTPRSFGYPPTSPGYPSPAFTPLSFPASPPLHSPFSDRGNQADSFMGRIK